MPEPRIEIYEPQRRGRTWTAAARVHFPEGTLDIVARAPEALVARQLARLQGLVAFRTAQRAPQIFRSTTPRGVAGAVGGFWDDVADTFGDIIGNETVQNIVNGVVSLIPVAGPILVGTGLTGAAMDAASAALDEAASETGDLDVAANNLHAEAVARQREAEQAAAEAERLKTAEADRLKRRAASAKRVRRGLLAAHAIAKRHGAPGLRRARGMSKAHDVAKKAAAGDQAAQEQVKEIAAQARTGDQEALEAFGYLVAMFEWLLAMLEQEWAADPGVVGITEEDREILRRIRELSLWKRELRRLIRDVEGRRRPRAPRVHFAAAAKVAAQRVMKRRILERIQRRARA